MSSRHRGNSKKPITCSECGKTIQEGSLKRHKEVMHGEITGNYVATCVDRTRAIYIVNRTARGRQDPVHVRKKTFGPDTEVRCSLQDCEDARDYAINELGTPSWECPHLEAASKANPYVEPATLNDDCLESLIANHLLHPDSKDRLINLRDNSAGPLIVAMDLKQCSSDRYRFFSVSSGSIHWWSPFGRCVTKYDTNTGSVHCACNVRSCIHKKITMWFLKCTDESLLIEDIKEESGESCELSQTKVKYPPTGPSLQKMVEYLHSSKRINPETKHEALAPELAPKKFIPVEEECPFCGDGNPLSGPYLVTRKAKILCQNALIEGMWNGGGRRS